MPQAVKLRELISLSRFRVREIKQLACFSVGVQQELLYIGSLLYIKTTTISAFWLLIRILFVLNTRRERVNTVWFNTGSKQIRKVECTLGWLVGVCCIEFAKP
jgi:hypothetical protein